MHVLTCETSIMKAFLIF